jgi:hypothetical protein
VTRRAGAHRRGDRGQPLGHGRGLVVDDVDDAAPAVLDGLDRRVGRILDVHEGPHAAAVADERELAPADHLGALAVARQRRAGP